MAAEDGEDGEATGVVVPPVGMGGFAALGAFVAAPLDAAISGAGGGGAAAPGAAGGGGGAAAAGLLPALGVGGGSLTERADADRALLQELARSFAKAPKYTADSLRSDRDLALRAVREHREGWRLLRHVTPELRADRELLLAAIKGSATGWRAVAFAAVEFREDREIGLEAVRRNAAALELLARPLRTDREFVSEALSSISRRLQAPPPKAAAQDWERSAAVVANNGSGMSRSKGGRKQRLSMFDAAGGERAEDWSERLRRETGATPAASPCGGGAGGGGGTATGDPMPAAGGAAAPGGEGGGGSLRIAPSACLRIRQHSGLILAKLATIEVNQSGHVDLKAKCELPGTLIVDGEQPRDSISRFLQSSLALFARGVTVEPEFQVVVEHDAPRRPGVPVVRHLRSVFGALMEPKFPWKKAAKAFGMDALRSPRGSIGKGNLGRRFGGGTSAYSAPRPPDMYGLLDKEQEHGRLLPSVSKRLTVYAWIPAWEYDWLRSSGTGQVTLAEWLSEVDIGPFFQGSQLSLGDPMSARSTIARGGSLALTSGDDSNDEMSDDEEGSCLR